MRARIVWIAEGVAHIMAGPDHRAAVVQFQEGPVKEHGVNGVQVEDVLEVCLERLRRLNQPPHAGRETALAITKLEEAVMWLDKRTRDREARGVEGTSQP